MGARTRHDGARRFGHSRHSCSKWEARTLLAAADPADAEPAYFLPSAVIVASLVLLIAALAWPAARLMGIVFVATAAGYLALIGTSAVMTLGDVRAAILGPTVFVIQLVAYASGSLWGGASVAYRVLRDWLHRSRHLFLGSPG